MKKLKYFLGGVFFSTLVLGGFIYYVLSKGETVMETTNSVEKKSVENYLIDDGVTQINLNEYDLMIKNFSKETLVAFWDSSCEDCLEEISILKEYTENRNIDFIFINIDAENIEVFNKIENLEIQRKYQLNMSEKLSDANQLDFINILFQNENIELGKLSFPLKVIYKGGTYHSVFEIANIENLYFKKLDKYFK